MLPSLRCYGERALSGVLRTQSFVAAHWCSQLVCLDVFFALGSLFPPVYFLLFCLWPPESPFFCLHSPSLCLMFSLSAFLSSSFIQTPSVLLQSFFLFLWTLYPSIKLGCLLFFYPLFCFLYFSLCCLRWESVLCHVVGGKSCRLDPAYVWLPETSEDREHLAAEWVGGAG